MELQPRERRIMTQASGAPRQGKTAETGTEDEGKEELAERLPTGAAGRALRQLRAACSAGLLPAHSTHHRTTRERDMGTGCLGDRLPTGAAGRVLRQLRAAL